MKRQIIIVADYFIFLVPKLCLGTLFWYAKLSLAVIIVPKCNLGTS
jgi:hypothetical protein